MKILHKCPLPHRWDIPYNVSQIEERWKCPECHTRWRIIYRMGGSEGSRLQPRGIRQLIWQYRIKREIKNDVP